MFSLHDFATENVSSEELGLQEGLSLFKRLQKECTSPEGLMSNLVKSLDSKSKSRDVGESAVSLCDESYFLETPRPCTKKHRVLRQGWQRPGPGAPTGSGRTIDVTKLTAALALVLSQLVMDCLEEARQSASALKELVDRFDPEVSLSLLAEWYATQTPLTKQKRNIWLLHWQLGFPAVLVKVEGETQAISVGLQFCSCCGTEFKNCIHKTDLGQAL